MTKFFEDVKINVKIKLSALWVTVVLIYLYADLYGFFIPGHIEDLIAGEIAGLQITQGIMLVFMILVVIPSLMVFLSLVLKAKANRWINIIVGILQTGIVIVSGIESSNSYFIFASSVEAVLLLLVVWYAWKWPIQET